MIQFKTALKQILLKNAITCSFNNNCNTFDENILSTVFPFKWNKNNILPVKENSNEDDEFVKMGVISTYYLLNNSNYSYDDCKKKKYI